MSRFEDGRGRLVHPLSRESSLTLGTNEKMSGRIVSPAEDAGVVRLSEHEPRMVGNATELSSVALGAAPRVPRAVTQFR